ncbi:MAG: AAA family ATPase, partial [Acidaminococcaceae bacterium]|nr:AAA family ATPase [Acidaminococcaceae bacterium]
MKKTTHFVCQNCGAIYPRWAGQCTACGQWNTIQEEAVATTDSPTATGGQNGRVIPFSDLRGAPEILFRLKSNISELDRVCGGGLVPGSVILVGGDPGIGKSTLLLQTVAQLAKGVNKSGSPTKCVYISGEESVDQVRLRALRLGLAGTPIDLASETRIRDIVATLDSDESPDIVVIDSIQTMYNDAVESAPGTVAQVRACG